MILKGPVDHLRGPVARRTWGRQAAPMFPQAVPTGELRSPLATYAAWL